MDAGAAGRELGVGVRPVRWQASRVEDGTEALETTACTFAGSGIRSCVQSPHGMRNDVVHEANIMAKGCFRDDADLSRQFLRATGPATSVSQAERSGKIEASNAAYS